MNIIDYIKVFESTPIIGLWGKFKIDKSKATEIFEVLGINNKTKELISEADIIGKDILDVFNIKRDKNIDLVYKKIKEDKTYNLKKYIPILNKFYDIEIISICNDIFVVWLTKAYEFDKYISKILDKTNCSMWIKDNKGRYIATNVNYEKYPDVKYNNMIGKNDFDIFPKEIAENFYKDDNKIINKELDYISTLTFVNDKCYDGSLYPVCDDNENVIGTLGFCIDVTEMNTSKVEVFSQKKMLELIGDNIPDHIFFKDFNGVFRYCNEAFAKSNGLSKDEILGKTELELSLISNYSPFRYIEEDENIYNTRKKIISEGVTILTDGKKVYMETVKVPFVDKNGMIGGILGISRDISHRKESEMEFEGLRMEFFANLTHEFRTPLNLIFSAIQLLNKKLERCRTCTDIECSNHGYSKYIDIINQNGFRLLKLVNNLIDSTKLGVGSLEYKPVNHDIVNYIENIFDSVIDFANQNGIEMIFDTNVEENIVAFDLDKMERIILNLISNSIKFNKHKGKIEIIINCSDEFVEIQVKDNGIGIPKDKLSDIFEKFKQANNRMTKISEGSGIGLYLVKSLVELHNGDINVESELNEYTKFIIKIPNILTKNESGIKKDTLSSKYVQNIKVEFSDIY
ncbi:MAG: PAS domain-containing sensor histidine kinase [Romboutsia sp.]